MATAQEVFEIAMDLIEERLENGTISTSDTASYRVSTPNILTVLQGELIQPGEIFNTFEISNKPIDNLLGNAHFDIHSFVGEERTYETTKPAYAYYFEVDRAGTVYVEDYNGTWNTLETISTTPNDGFAAYKGIVTPSVGATKSRLRFTGSYYYLNVNRALFGVNFASSDDVPDYRPWVKVEMPSDFKKVDEVVTESRNEYNKSASYKWEGRNNLYINYFFGGNIRVIYHPTPSVITDLSDELQVDNVTARTVLPYGLASQLMLQENPAIASYFNERYVELKREEQINSPAPIGAIQNVYGGFG